MQAFPNTDTEALPSGANKAVFRVWAKARRAQIPPDELAVYTADLCRQVRTLPEWKEARHVLIYLAMPGEIDVESLMKNNSDDGEAKTFYAPRCGPKRELVIHPYVPGHTPLVSGVWGLREPDAALVPDIAPALLDLVLAPALLLTPTGDRLGYGGGYYDRFLPNLSPSCLSVGLLPHPLVVPHLPVEAWDTPVDLVLSAQGF